MRSYLESRDEELQAVGVAMRASVEEAVAMAKAKGEELVEAKRRVEELRLQVRSELMLVPVCLLYSVYFLLVYLHILGEGNVS